MTLHVAEEEHQPFLKYSDDATIDHTESEPSRRHQPEGRYSRLFSCCLVFIVTSALWIAVIYFISPTPQPTPQATSKGDDYSPKNRHNITSNSRLITCGNSTAEAKALDCRYDILLNHWIPSQCWDQDMIDEYQDDDSWTGYYDRNLTQPIKTVDIMAHSDHYWTSTRDHINHCATMWKRQFGAIFDERPAIDSLIASPGHTDHCAQYLMDATLKNFTEPTAVYVGFAGCWVRNED
ncbi:uncharacterized protein RSE6_03214 [Rhynchosporium secalis]|uniref:Uncharacterized protein n=1 Tax=Rhynchosporium secalis TaxID=38038 RepID=A0A1E1M3Q3_RHYSE|nr:uncharacterized protein RSE6_03214 [Rhynchosporium secalis]